MMKVMKMIFVQLMRIVMPQLLSLLLSWSLRLFRIIFSSLVCDLFLVPLRLFLSKIYSNE